MIIPKIGELFDLKEFKHKAIFEGLSYPWEVLKAGYKAEYIKKIINTNCSALKKEGNLVLKTVVIWKNEIYRDDFEIIAGSPAKGQLKIFRKGTLLPGASCIVAGAYIVGNEIEIGEGSLIEEGAFVAGPTIIGDKTEVRQGAYVRGEVITGEGCVIGHTTEMKSSIMLNHSKAPHFAYVGDSVLGNNVNLGAGTKVSNLKITGDEIIYKADGRELNTGLRKFGALIGDGVETGCNSVLNPGVVLGKESMVYPCVSVRKGIYPPFSLFKGESIGKVEKGK